VKGEEKKKKWKTIKVNEEAYILLRKISALLGMREYEVVFVSLFMMYAMMQEDVENAKKVLERLKERVVRQKWLINNIMNTLDEILKR